MSSPTRRPSLDALRVPLGSSAPNRTPQKRIKLDHVDQASKVRQELASALDQASNRENIEHTVFRERSEKARHTLEELSRRTDELQALQQKKGANISGILKNIKLYNFMCHTSFTQEWHPNLNFVTGENGSGKSALLSAILIGLGGKAASTSRTSSVKDLIKTGASHAKIEITLANKGKFAESHGKEITIQRLMTINGTSTYKIKRDGETAYRPLTKTKLDAMLLKLDINLNNPVIVLNQEYARSFLRSKDPKDKYKLFEDGTGTADCDAMRQHVGETLKDIEKIIEEKTTEKDKIEEEYSDCRDKVKLINELGDKQAILNQLKCELEWYHVKAAEKQEKEALKEVYKAESDHKKAQEFFADSQEKLENFDNQSSLDSEMRALTDRQKTFKVKRDQVVQTLTNLNKQKVSIGMQRKSREEAIESRKVNLVKLDERIRKAEEEDREKYAQELHEYEIAKSQLEEKKRSLASVVTTLESEKGFFSDGIRSKNNEVNDATRTLSETRTRIRTKERDLQQMYSTESNYSVYGRSMMKLMDKLSTCMHEFKQPPKGPLGNMIVLKNTKFSQIVERTLFKIAKNFVVDNKEDFRRLDRLICEAYEGADWKDRKPDVHVIRYTPEYDVSQTNVSRGPHPSILDVLEIEDPMVKNALIDVVQIEKRLLFTDAVEATSFLEDARRVPKGCLCGYSEDLYEVTPVPKLAVKALPDGRLPYKYLKTGQRSLTAVLETEIQTLKEEEMQLQGQIQVIQGELDVLKIGGRDKERELLKAKTEKQKLDHELRALIATLPKNESVDVESLKETVGDRKNEIETIQQEIVELDVKFEEIREQLDEMTAQRRHLSAELESIEHQKRDAEEQNENRERNRLKLQQFVVKYENLLGSAVTKLNDVKAKAVSLNMRVAEATERAELYGERMETNRSSREIQDDYTATRAKVDYLKQFKDQHVEIQKRFEAISKRRSKFMKDYGSLESLQDQVKQYFQIVNAYYLNARNTIVQGLEHCYAEIAKSRKYHGKLVINHDDRELFYLVCPDKDSLDKVLAADSDPARKKKKMVEYAAGLSGGERSFSTLCFIIAMWQVMKAPFYMLDEFDVFMDAQNRAVSQAALMAHARSFPHNQFFFFTPLDLTALPTAREALILRLYPPERNTEAIENMEED